MKNAVGIVLIAIVAGGIAGYVAQMDFGQGATKQTAEATIFFYGAPGSCKAKVAPDPILAEKNWAIDWTIVDLCGLAEGDTVGLQWGTDPLENLVTVPKKRIKGDLKGSVSEGDKFTYQVTLNGSVVGDPDVEIVQF